MERRLFERRPLSLNAVLKGADGLHIPCVIQDFCTGGLLVRVSGDADKMSQPAATLAQGKLVTVVVPTQQDRFELEAVVSRVLGDQFGLKLQRSNARMLGAFRVLHERQYGDELLADGQLLSADEVTDAIGRTQLAMPQAGPSERSLLGRDARFHPPVRA